MKKIRISESLLKKEAKSIKKLNSNLNYTQILDIISSGLGYIDYNEYKLDQRVRINLIDLRDLNIVSLNEIQDEILNLLDLNPLFNEIHFITREIKAKLDVFQSCEESFTVCQELNLHSYSYRTLMIKEREPIVSNDFSYTIENLDCYIYGLLARYRLSEIHQDLFSKVLKSKSASAEELEFIDSNRLYELKKYLNKKELANDHEDFILPWLYEMLFDSDDMHVQFRDAIESRIALEKKFYTEVKSDFSDLVTFMTPVLTNSSSKDPVNLNKVAQHTNKEHPVLLGLKTKSLKNETFLSRIKSIGLSTPLLLKREELLDNVYLHGDMGSGVSDTSLQFLLQHVRNDLGFIHFCGDMSEVWKLRDYVKCFKSNDNLIILKIESPTEITKEMIQSFIYNKKKVVILSGHNHDYSCDFELLETICREGTRSILKKLNEIQNNKPFIISVSSQYCYLDNDTLSELSESLFDLNRNKLSLMYCDYRELSFKASVLNRYFKTLILMKSHEHKMDESFGLPVLHKLGAGQFFYVKNNVVDQHSIYTVPFVSTSVSEYCYLSIPIGYK